MKILISTTSFGKYDAGLLNRLRNISFETAFNPHGRTLTEREISDLLVDVNGLIAGTEPLTREVLTGAKELKVISRCGTGLDNVDINAAKELGVKIFNTPDAPTRAVAEFTLGLILNCLRNISNCDRNIRNGVWEKPMGVLLDGKKVGIIGFGRIGRTVSQLVQAFGAKILAYDISECPETSGVRMVSFHDLITEADIISLHIPVEKSNGYLIDANVVDLMKSSSYIVNTSRGGLIDEEALYHALKTKRLAGAAIDTFESEPYNGKLTELDNIILTSHVGSYAREARILMEMQAVDNLLKGLGV